MTDLQQIQKQIHQKRKAFTIADNEYYQALQQHTLLKDGDEKLSQSEIEKMRQNREAARFNLHAALNLLSQSETPQQLLTQISSEIPFLLLPLRIEARYIITRHVVRNLNPDDWIESTGITSGLEQEEEGNWTYQVPQLKDEEGFLGRNSLASKVKTQQIKPKSSQYIERRPDKNELCIRFYPDEIFKHAHEPNLMPAEWESGKAFWGKIFSKSEPEEKTWLNFSSTMSPARAAWIVRVTQPLNFKFGEPIPDEPKFPNDPALKDGAYSLPPTVLLLPECIVVRLYSSDGTFKEFNGKPIPEPIRLGLDPTDDPFDESPTNSNFSEENGQIKAPNYLQWVQDLDLAEKQGLAVRIDLNQHPEFKDGVAKIIVLGTKLSADHAESAKFLDEHLENCLYKEEGMSLLSQGTPTNNFGDSKSGFNQKEKNSLAYFRSVFQGNKIETSQMARDDFYLHHFLGLSKKISIPKGEQTDIDEAKNMNNMLWHSTWGYYLLQFFSPVITETKREMLRQFFGQYVTGRGLLPVLRVNQQPIGIIPTTNWSLWQYKGNTPEEKFLSEVWTEFLSKLKMHWASASEKVNAASNKTTSSGSLDESFLEMLSTSASSVKFQGQFLTGTGIKSILENMLNQTNAKLNSIINLENQLTNINARILQIETEIRENIRVIAQLNLILANPFLAGKIGKKKERDALEQKNKDLSSQSNSLKSDRASIQKKINLSIPNKNTLLESQAQLTSSIQNLKNDSNAILDSEFSRFLARLSENIVGAQKLSLPNVLIDSLPLSEELPAEKIAGKSWNYLEWLLNAKLSEIWNNEISSAPEGDGDPESQAETSLFALLTRQSLLRVLLESHLKATESNPGLWLLKVKDFELEQLETSGEIKFNPMTLDPKNFLHQQYKPIVEAFKTDLTAPISLKTDRRQYFDKLDTSNLRAWINQSGPIPMIKPLAELEKALQIFKDTPTARLARLFTEHLDLCSHRMDAWMSGLIFHRLDKQRKTRPQGIQLGAFGYLLNLKPKTPRDIVVVNVEPTFIPASSQNFKRAAIPVVNIKAANDKGIDLTTSTNRAFFYIGENAAPRIWLNVHSDQVEADTLINISKSDGFIHMPSLTHATTAAIMRAGHLAHQADTQTESLSINLTAPRVRKALQIMEGMQAGTPLSELLGHLFERSLHEKGLDGYRFEFRNAFPLKEDLKANSKTQLMASLDGFSLLKAFQRDQANWLKVLKDANGHQLSISLNDKAKLTDIAKSLEDDYLDSTGDLLLTESVYQTAKGNIDRAAAALRSLNTGGQVLLPDFVNVPQNGHGLSHRIMIVFPSVKETEKGNIWSPNPSPRTTLAPNLNKWLSRQLPNPSKILIAATLPNGNKVRIKLSEIGIEPIDLLYQIPSSFRQGANCQLHLWVQSKLLKLPDFNIFQEKAPIKIDFKDRAGFDISEISIFEVSALLVNLKKIIESSRPIQPSDFSHLGNNNGKLVLQLVEDVLKTHLKDSSSVSVLPGILRDLSNTLRKSISENASIAEQCKAAAKLCEPLVQASLFGIEEACCEGIVPFDSDRFDFLADNAETVALKLENRLKILQQVLSGLPIDESQRFQQLQNAASELMGKNVFIFPLVELTNASSIQTAIDQRKQLTNTDADTVDEWLAEAALVRKPLRYFRQLTMLRELIPDIQDSFREPAVTQLPFVPQSAWIGGPIKESDLEKLAPEFRPTTSIVLESPEDFKAEESFAGILLDEWSELIPSSTTNTGLTFQYDQPNTEPPQAMLLAVSPIEGGNWQWEHLIGSVEDALQLSKSRLVKPELLQNENKFLGSILPAITIPFLTGNRNIPNSELIKPKT